MRSTSCSVPEGIAALRAGGIVIAERGTASISRWTLGAAEPTLGWRVGTFHRDRGGFVQPVDVAPLGDRVFVLDRLRRVIVELDVTPSAPRWTAEIELSSLLDPEAIEVAPDGRLFVLDAGANVVRVVEGGVLTERRIGEFGRGDTGMSCPHDMALAADGVLYVADSGNRRIQRYRLDGTCLGPWGTYGDGPDQFIDPTGVALDRDGNLLVADRYGHRIQIFDSQTGKEVYERRVRLPSHIRYPTRLAAFPDGRCVVTCPQPSEVWVLTCP